MAKGKQRKLKPEDVLGKRYDDYETMWADIECLADNGHFGFTYDEITLRGGRVVCEIMTVEAWSKKYPEGLKDGRPDVAPDPQEPTDG